jgi:hypothetical protein
MHYHRFAICIVLGLAGCGEMSRVTPLQSSGMSPAEAKAAFSSTEALTKALERRWPVSAIKVFCTSERRHDPEWQNLVPDSGVKWEEDLYPNSDTGFDKIYWYANVENGRATTYSLNARRGHDSWLIEIGGEELIRKPPDATPDPKRPGFVGHP